MRATRWRSLTGALLAAALVSGGGQAARAQAAPTTANPFGVVDEIDANAPGGVRLRGWLIDPDSNAPVRLGMLLDGVAVTPLTAGLSRPDVGAAYPTFGAGHGFDGVIPVGHGAHSFCLYGINNGPGADTQFGCGTISRNASPFGVVDVLVLRPGGVRVAGWVIDPDTVEPVSMAFTVDGVAVGDDTPASRPRPDLAAAHPLYGPDHGYDVTVPVGHGQHEICIIGRNTGTGSDTVFGCGPVTRDANPFGTIDDVKMAPGGIRVRGWIIDPDTSAPTTARIEIDGVVSVTIPADVARPDVAAAHPPYGPNHGYDAVVDVPLGTHNFCVRAINLATGGDVLFGCGTVTRTA
jgi:hypothetical protein